MISAIVLTKNNQKTIIDCLKSLDFVDEIIIIDDFSEDGTLSSVRKLLESKIDFPEVKIFKRKLTNFDDQRNYAFGISRNNWLFFVDADEIVSNDLKRNIRLIFSRSEELETQAIGALLVKRRDFFWGKELKFGEIFFQRYFGIIRLVNKNSGRFNGKVHERFILDKSWKTKKIGGWLDHFPHPSINSFIKSINDYSTLRAKELQAKKNLVRLIFELILFPPIKFFVSYFLFLGFLDGPAGFVYSFMMSFHSFLVRAKIFQFKYNEKFS